MAGWVFVVVVIVAVFLMEQEVYFKYYMNM